MRYDNIDCCQNQRPWMTLIEGALCTLFDYYIVLFSPLSLSTDPKIHDLESLNNVEILNGHFTLNFLY